MFQYAFIKTLSLRNKVDFKLDISWFDNYLNIRPYELEIFNIERKYIKYNDLPFYVRFNSSNKYISIIFKWIIFLFKKMDNNYYIEKQFNFKKKFLNIKSWYIEWYFQTEKYFIDFKNQIRKDFEFIIEPWKQNKEIIKIINSCNSVSLHIRRWDYLLNKNSHIWFLWLKYYKNAINIIKGEIKKVMKIWD